jgi:hypothetical protein
LNQIRWAYRRGIVVTPIKNYNFIVDLAGGDLELSHRDYNFSYNTFLLLKLFPSSTETTMKDYGGWYICSSGSSTLCVE